MSNVIALTPVHDTGEPVQEVVDRLEEILARAKAGDVRALAVAWVGRSNATDTLWVPGTADAHYFVAAIQRLAFSSMWAWYNDAMPVALPPVGA